jgi:hypothetical protein
MTVQLSLMCMYTSSALHVVVELKSAIAVQLLTCQAQCSLVYAHTQQALLVPAVHIA